MHGKHASLFSELLSSSPRIELESAVRAQGGDWRARERNVASVN